MHLPAGALGFRATLWPWSLIAYVVWFAGASILAQFFNEFMLKLTPIVTVATPALLSVIVLAAFARDTQRQIDSVRARSMSG